MRIPLLRRLNGGTGFRRGGGKRLLREADDLPEYDLWLVCTDGLLRGSASPITDRAPVTIGPEAGCSFRFPADRPGGPCQARIYWEGGRLLLTAADPAGVVRMEGGEPLSPMQPREVRPGDAFSVGNGQNRFEIRN